MKKWILGIGRAFLNLIYPLSCLTCGSKIDVNKGLCDRCVASIRPSSAGIAACKYEGVLKRAIHLFKYKGFLALLGTLSDQVLAFIDKNIDIARIDAIIPIPLHPVRQRSRGFNQALLLANSVSRKYGIPVINNNLIKTRQTQPQSGLNRSSRLENMKNTFRVNRPEAIKNKNLLLIDDVYTTGATIKNASLKLKGAGAKSVNPIVLARGI